MIDDDCPLDCSENAHATLRRLPLREALSRCDEIHSACGRSGKRSSCCIHPWHTERASDHKRHRRSRVINSKLHASRPALLVENGLVRRRKIILDSQTVGDGSTAEFRAQNSHAFIVTVEDELAAGFEMSDERTLLREQFLRGPEIFKMCRDVRYSGDDYNIGTEPPRDVRDITGTVCSDFKHEPVWIRASDNRTKETGRERHEPDERILCGIGKSENRKRHADVAVETFYAFAYAQRRRERTVYSVLRRRFSDTTCHRDDFRAQPCEQEPRLARENPDDNAFEC